MHSCRLQTASDSLSVSFILRLFHCKKCVSDWNVGQDYGMAFNEQEASDFGLLKKSYDSSIHDWRYCRSLSFYSPVEVWLVGSQACSFVFFSLKKNVFNKILFHARRHFFTMIWIRNISVVWRHGMKQLISRFVPIFLTLSFIKEHTSHSNI